MKIIIVLACIVVVSFAEPPVRNTYYFAKQQEAPYPASGWTPDGPAFELPQKQIQGAPAKQYGAPVAPQDEYGAPERQSALKNPSVQAPQRQFGSSAGQQNQYRAPAASTFGGSFRNPSNQASQRQYGAPAAPQNQYGTPAEPQNQYGAPAEPQNQYGAPAVQQNQFRSSAVSTFGASFKNPSNQAPQRQYGAPAAPQNHYGTPATPQNQYGTPATPQSQYGTPAEPQNQYGTPQYPSESSTVPDYDETTFPTTESQAEPVESVNELDEVGNVDEQKQGEYFIALPDGRLQRVQYVSRQDLEAMKYFARIQAENVEPLRGPIYAYQPLQKLQFAPTNLEVQGVAAKLQVPVAAKVEVPKEDVAVPVASFSSLNYQPEQRFLINF